jgi:hypothetical protein
MLQIQTLVDQDRHDEIVDFVFDVAILHFFQLNLKGFGMLCRVIPFW